MAFKLLKQGYSSRKRQTIFRNVHGRHTDLDNKFYTLIYVTYTLKDLITKCDI